MKSVIAATIILTIISVCQAGEPIATNQDNVILEKVLQRRYDDGGFTVIAPMTDVAFLARKEPEASKMKEYVKERIKLEGYDLGPLLDKLLEKNRVANRLSIESHPERGYLVDYDGQFNKYFEKDGGGWKAWYKHHPKAHGHTGVSLPAYDEKHGIVLIYIGTQSDWLAGAGFLVAYRYENGNLKELARVMLWIS